MDIAAVWSTLSGAGEEGLDLEERREAGE